MIVTSFITIALSWQTEVLLVLLRFKSRLFLQSYHHHATIRPNDDDWSSDKPSVCSLFCLVIRVCHFEREQESSSSIHHLAKMSKKLQAPHCFYIQLQSLSFSVFDSRLLQLKRDIWGLENYADLFFLSYLPLGSCNFISENFSAQA